MKKIFSTLLIALIASLLLPIPAKASSVDYFTDFESQQPELFYEIYEGGVHYPNLACGTDACVFFETQGQRTFGRFVVNPSATPGFYQNAATSHIQLPSEPNQGPYSVTYGHPITMEAKIKWSANYDIDGLSDAQGTSGIVLWNGAVGTEGETAEYDHIGFMWASQDVLFGAISGFMANSFVDQFPVDMSRPTLPIDINEWVKVKLVWSEDINGVQSVTYSADGQLLGTHVLPTHLEGLGLEIWNDNQEPVFCEEGICNTFPNPNQPQSFFVDYVKITQP
ncbi:MAG TPA: hypothetical protein VLF20_05070 [Patescibacteria group bacterium]|nr:hypothetical protein [Patescibacteria group bacterium]